MRERRCFVQFIHPGGEHSPDQGDLKFWNREAHRRKFLKSRGRYIAGGAARESELVFWGEWEPESRVLARPPDRVADGPHFLYEPFFVDHRDGVWRQNTDPCVFGERFHYTGCLQHTRLGPTQLRFLTPGSLVLFGSCREKSRFAVDTVFIASHHVDHSARDWEDALDGKVSGVYRKITLEPWYSGSVPQGQSHRLYFGATPEKAVAGMFSFFPCRPYDHGVLSERVQAREKARSRASTLQLEAAILSLSPIVLFLLVGLASPAYLEAYRTPAGTLVGVIGGLLIFGCYLLMRRLGRVPEPRRTGGAQ